MTEYRVDILLPLRFNPTEKKKIKKLVPEMHFFETYEDLVKICGGISTTYSSMKGSWVCPKTKVRYDDETILFSVVVEPESDSEIIYHNPKIKELQKLKKALLKRFKQKKLYMLATPCHWL